MNHGIVLFLVLRLSRFVSISSDDQVKEDRKETHSIVF